MSWVDLSILTVVAVSVVLSLFRGLVRELVSLAAWVVAFAVALGFYEALAQRFEGILTEAWMRTAAAFLILLVGTLIVGGIVGYVVGRILAKGGLSGPDRLLGGVFGFVRGVAIVALVALMLGATPLVQTELWRGSTLLPQLEALAGAVVRDYGRLAAGAVEEGALPPVNSSAQDER